VAEEQCDASDFIICPILCSSNGTDKKMHILAVQTKTTKLPALAPELQTLRLRSPHWAIAYGTVIDSTNRTGDNGSQIPVKHQSK